MMRLWLLCRYFDTFHGRKGGTIQYYDGTVNKNEFLNYLLNEKHFGEDVRETLKRWIHNLIGVWILQNDKGHYRAQKSRRMVYDLFQEAKRRFFLLESGDNLNSKLEMDDRGRKFIKLLTFLNTVAKEYSYFTSTLSIILGSVGGTLLIVFWNKIIGFFASLLL